MALFEPALARRLELLAQISYANPFLPERLDLERKLLGSRAVDQGPIWHLGMSRGEDQRPNVQMIMDLSEKDSQLLIQKLQMGERPATTERQLLEDFVLFYTFHRLEPELFQLAQEENPRAFQRQCKELHLKVLDILSDHLAHEGLGSELLAQSAHIFALFYQVRRAFFHIFSAIAGQTMVSAKLRASVWQSIFTLDMRRYRRSLYRRMAEIPCLITGPSGSGKELVAQAIGRSAYIPFDPVEGVFARRGSELIKPVNLSALSPTLIESELFGHVKGSFTGALADRDGLLRVCPDGGVVFLDEIGELDPVIQIKLLRLLQTREYTRVGESEPRVFTGRIIAATHRDLSHEMRNGKFRKDFFYRICADTVRTPALAEIIKESPAELDFIIAFICNKWVDPNELNDFAAEVKAVIQKDLGDHYPWPGNYRELEQCVRSVLVNGEYQPVENSFSGLVAGSWLAEIKDLRVDSEELLRQYYTRIYFECGSWEEASQRLRVDRRTVKAHVDEKLLAELKAGAE